MEITKEQVFEYINDCVDQDELRAIGMAVQDQYAALNTVLNKNFHVGDTVTFSGKARGTRSRVQWNGKVTGKKGKWIVIEARPVGTPESYPATNWRCAPTVLTKVG